jgi:hypothetical protein
MSSKSHSVGFCEYGNMDGPPVGLGSGNLTGGIDLSTFSMVMSLMGLEQNNRTLPDLLTYSFATHWSPGPLTHLPKSTVGGILGLGVLTSQRRSCVYEMTAPRQSDKMKHISSRMVTRREERTVLQILSRMNWTQLQDLRRHVSGV